MNKFFNFIEKHAKLVLILILLITAFFGYKAFDIYVNADFSAFMPWGEYRDTYKGGIEGQIPELGTEKAKKKEYIYQYEITDKDKGKIKSEIDITQPKANPAYEDVVSVEDLPVIATQKVPDYNRSTNYMILLEAEDIFTAKKLDLIEYVINELNQMPEFFWLTSPLDFVTIEKSGSRLVTKPISPKTGALWTEEEAKILEERIDRDPVMKYFLVGGSGNSLLFQFHCSNLSPAKLQEVDEKLDLLENNGIRVYLSGGAVINNKVMEYLMKDLITLVGLCLVVILVVFYFSFRSKRSVLIPASLAIISLIWTFGTMSMMGISLNILNIVTPCMVLTLGSAYAIHVLSEYYAHYRKGDKLTPVQSTKGILNTILFACLTTVCGFLALGISQTEGLKDFGISVSFGVGYCAILACIYLPAILTLVKPPKQKQIENYSNGFMSKIVKFLSVNVTKYWIPILLILVILIAGFTFTKDKISVNSNYMSYFPEEDIFGQESRHFAAELGGGTPFMIEITAPEGERNFFLKTENLTKVREYEETLLACPDILQSISFSAYVAYANEIMNGEKAIPDSNGLILMINRLISMMANQVGGQISTIVTPDGNKLTLIIQHWDALERDLMTAGSISRVYTAIVDNLGMLPEDTTVVVSGDPLPNIKFSNRIIADQNRSTVLSLIIVFLLSLITAKSFRKGFLTIVPVVCGIMINYIFMYFAHIPFDIVTVCFSSIAIGCGVDDAIHFMIRLRHKEKENPDEPYIEKIKDVIIETGRPIILTTVSIVLGMMMLSFASYTPIRYFGLLMSITLFGCMASTLIFLPPVAILIDKISNKSRRK